MDLEPKGNLGAAIYVFALWKNGSRTTKCDGLLHPMLRNATECYGMLHPDGAHPAISTDKQRLTRTDATKCYGMLRTATVCEKAGRERDLWRVDGGAWRPWVQSSRFKVQCWEFLTKSNEIQRSTQRNPTKSNGIQHLHDVDPTESNEIQRFGKKEAWSETCGEWTVDSAQPTKSNGQPNGIQRNLTESNTFTMSTQRNLTKSNTRTQRNLTKSNVIQRFAKKEAGSETCSGWVASPGVVKASVAPVGLLAFWARIPRAYALGYFITPPPGARHSQIRSPGRARENSPGREPWVRNRSGTQALEGRQRLGSAGRRGI